MCFPTVAECALDLCLLGWDACRVMHERQLVAVQGVVVRGARRAVGFRLLPWAALRSLDGGRQSTTCTQPQIIHSSLWSTRSPWGQRPPAWPPREAKMRLSNAKHFGSVVYQRQLASLRPPVQRCYDAET